jgi:hypothetical protein
MVSPKLGNAPVANTAARRALWLYLGLDGYTKKAAK